MSDSKSRQTREEKQAEMLRYNLVLRKKQIEERNRLKEKKSGEKQQNPDTNGK